MIRPARPQDAAALARLWNPWITDTAITFNPVPKTGAEIASVITARHEAGHAFLVAEDGDGLLGFSSYSQFRGGIGYARCMEHTIILAPDARGRGTGRALMAAIEDHARKAGAHQLIGAVSGENPEARAFHERIGFRLLATIPEAGFKFGRYMDLLLLAKRL